MRTYIDFLGFKCNQARTPFLFTFASLFTIDALYYLMRFNWEKIMTELKRIGYKGDLTFEILLYLEFVPKNLISEALSFAEKIGRHLISFFENA